MIQHILLIILVVGDWFFANRENIIFAVECTQNQIFGNKGEIQ